ncbi:MAG: PilZ domain-containing protein [Candidatus Omnitrophota bacterium]|jgi:hypothetical protein
MQKTREYTTRHIVNRLPIAEKRHFIRHPLHIPLSYKIDRNSKEGNGHNSRTTTLDVSIGGLLFSARRPAKIGSTIKITMPFQDKEFHITAKVVHCRRNPETKMYNIGAHFYRVRDAFKVKLREQVYLINEFRHLWSRQLGKEVSLEEASLEWIKRYSERFRRLYW